MLLWQKGTPNTDILRKNLKWVGIQKTSYKKHKNNLKTGCTLTLES
jgi:hypothetical protein